MSSIIIVYLENYIHRRCGLTEELHKIQRPTEEV
jgi:hypothetical protein